MREVRFTPDGWDAYVKPFRTLEDVYVLSAMTAWLYGVGQDSDWPQALQLPMQFGRRQDGG